MYIYTYFIFVGMFGFFQASYPTVPGLIIILDSRMLNKIMDNFYFKFKLNHLENMTGNMRRQKRLVRRRKTA